MCSQEEQRGPHLRAIILPGHVSLACSEKTNYLSKKCTWPWKNKLFRYLSLSLRPYLFLNFGPLHYKGYSGILQSWGAFTSLFCKDSQCAIYNDQHCQCGIRHHEVLLFKMFVLFNILMETFKRTKVSSWNFIFILFDVISILAAKVPFHFLFLDKWLTCLTIDRWIDG